jgi:hypothetical protein
MICICKIRWLLNCETNFVDFTTGHHNRSAPPALMSVAYQPPCQRHLQVGCAQSTRASLGTWVWWMARCSGALWARASSTHATGRQAGTAVMTSLKMTAAALRIVIGGATSTRVAAPSMTCQAGDATAHMISPWPAPR